MKKSFTKLASVGIACFCMMFAFGQENTLNLQVSEDVFALQQNEVELRIGENKWPEVWPDSIITYSFSGELVHKQEFVSKSANSVSHNNYSWENNAWFYRGSGNYTQSDYDFDPYIYDSDYGLMIRVPRIQGGLGLTLSHGNHDPASKVEYNNSGQIVYAAGAHMFVNITYNGRGQVNTVLHDNLQGGYNIHYQYQYDENGNLISCSSNHFSQTAFYDSQGRRIRTYTCYSECEYAVYYYPDGYAPIVDTENNNPVGDDNRGGYDFTIGIPTDSIAGGTFVVKLPEGFTMDENNTRLTIEFSDLFDLIITRQADNSWLFELKPKTLRSAALRSAEAKNMLHVAYTVDETLVKGTYDISVHSILFETKGGNLIPEPAITVPAVVERFGVGNEQIALFTPAIYTVNQTIHIRAENAERITVYSIMGHKLYEAEILPGINTVNATRFPQGILFIRGSNGWVTKVVNR